ncbi:MAG: thioredoxin family protein [Pirellulales bacterium]|nr:thioredoxin family protein [Pirellulales bacterium]
MTAVVLTALMQVLAVGAIQADFESACRESAASQRRLVVLIGANWCAACQTMQKNILPQVEKAGGLKNVVFAYVDFDRQRQVAAKLTAGKPIPQLIRFDPTPSGWRSERLIGARNQREVGEFINAGVLDKETAARAPDADRPQAAPSRTAADEAGRSTAAPARPAGKPSAEGAGGRPAPLDPPRAEKGKKPPQRTAFFKRLFGNGKKQRGNTTR